MNLQNMVLYSNYRFKLSFFQNWNFN